MTSDDCRLSKETGDGYALIVVEGRLTEGALPGFEKALRAVASEAAVLVDLAGLEYICSWGLGILVERARAAEEGGRRFLVVQPATRLAKLFTILNLDLLLTFVASRDEAEQALDN